MHILMKGTHCGPIVIGIWLLCVFIAFADVPPAARAAIDRITQRHGTYVVSEGAYRLTFPRTDVTAVSGKELVPALGYGSWFSFAADIHHGGMITGELLLFEDEVNPVLTSALNSGLEVTGLGAPFLFARPALRLLDVNAVGSFEQLAAGVRRCLDESQSVRRMNGKSPASAFGESAAPTGNAIDGARLDAILLMRGHVVDGVYRAVIGRAALLHGTPVGREMGMNTWVAFAGTNELAVAEGQIVAALQELQPVLKALRAKRINVTEIRNHTLGEHPQMVFVHFWGQGAAEELAKALRYVLEVQVGTP
jgi:hypothetical protein